MARGSKDKSPAEQQAAAKEKNDRKLAKQKERTELKTMRNIERGERAKGGPRAGTPGNIKDDPKDKDDDGK